MHFWCCIIEHLDFDMNDFNPQQFGKLIFIAGLVVAAAGLLIMLLSKTGLFRLPGDIFVNKENFKFYFPVASCIIISAVLTLLFWIINYFRK